MMSGCEEEASNTDREDASLTMRRFDGEVCVKEEEILVKSEFGSCAGSDDIAFVDNNDEDGVCFEPLNFELDIVNAKEEHDFEEEPAIKNELSSADKEEACNADRQDAGLTMSCAGSDDIALVVNNDGEKRYRCKLCNHEAAQLGNLQRHMRTHTGEKPYSCKLCNYKTGHPGNLSGHMRTHTGEKRYSCKLCNYKAIQPGNLAMHMRTHTGEKPYPCKLCHYKTAQPGSLSRHMRTHTGERPFKCPLCVYSYVRRSDLRKHMIGTHPEAPPLPVQMPRRSKTSNSIRSIGQEEEASSTDQQDAGLTMSCAGSEDSALVDNNYEDGVCFEPLNPELVIVNVKEEHDFEEEPAIKNEVSSANEEEASNADPEDASLTMSCAVSDNSALLDNNDGEKPYLCKLCNYKTAQPGKLARHLRTHTGERPFKCPLCVYSYVRRSDLGKHMIRTHPEAPPLPYQMPQHSKTSNSIRSIAKEEEAINTDREDASLTMSCAVSDNGALEDNNDGLAGEKPYPCKLCNYKATQPGHLSTHMRTHTGLAGEKPYPCKLCNYKATQPGHLSTHMRTHTGEKPYACDWCSFRTARLGTLNAHKLIHTGERPFKCPLCVYSYVRRSELRRHMIRTHPEAPPLPVQMPQRSKTSDSIQSIGKEEEASNPDREDASLTRSCAGSDNSALVDNNDSLAGGEKPYSCKLCNYKATQPGHLSRHMRAHTGEKPYACDQCSFWTACLSSLNAHKLIHTEEEANITDQQDAGLTMSCAGSDNSALMDNNDEGGACFEPLNPELVIVNVKEEHDFEEEPAIKNELSSADEEEASNIDWQDASLIMSSAGSDDIALQDNNDGLAGENRYRCKLCNYKSAEPGNLSRHMRTHTGEKPHACDRCSFRTARLSSLNAHKLIHTGEKPYSCKLCNYKSTRPGDLALHMRTHTGEKPHACDQCSFRAAHLSSLNAHKFIHTGEKPYSCKLCNYKTTRPGDLALHMRTHTGEKPYACKLCNYKSTQPGNLSMHMRTHTGEKPYACDQCSFRAAHVSSLNEHKLIHTGEKPSKCPLCVYSCVKKCDLKRHMIRTHPEAPPLPVQMPRRSKTSNSIRSIGKSSLP